MEDVADDYAMGTEFHRQGRFASLECDFGAGKRFIYKSDDRALPDWPAENVLA
jgi:hypothetical protein